MSVNDSLNTNSEKCIEYSDSRRRCNIHIHNRHYWPHRMGILDLCWHQVVPLSSVRARGQLLFAKTTMFRSHKPPEDKVGQKYTNLQPIRNL